MGTQRCGVAAALVSILAGRPGQGQMRGGAAVEEVVEIGGGLVESGGPGGEGGEGVAGGAGEGGDSAADSGQPAGLLLAAPAD